MIELLIGSFNNVAICLIISVIAFVVSDIVDDFYYKGQDVFESKFILDAYIYLVRNAAVNHEIRHHLASIKNGKQSIYTK